MPINPQHQGSFTILDNSNEQSRMGFNFGAITAASLPGFLTEFGALRTAVNAIILGNIIQEMWVGDVTQFAKLVPADVNAQRERKWLVQYQDDTTFALYRVEIPTAEFTGRLQPLSDLADLTQTEMAAFVTAFEQLARSPEGNAVTVLQIRAVGRST